MFNKLIMRIYNNRFFLHILTLLRVGQSRTNRLVPGLYCFNYHRVGDKESTKFDPNVYSCTSIQFEKHIKFIKKNFKILSIADVVEALNSGEVFKEKCALITFDDGYVDNYKTVFPILQRHHLSATFFIPTQFIGSSLIPWWDELAHVLRESSVDKVQLDGWNEAVVIDHKNIAKTIRSVSRLLKLETETVMQTKLDNVRKALKVNKDISHEKIQLFMDWDMVKEMHVAGMDIGSHSCTHQILSHLTSEQQNEEISGSREIISSRIGYAVESFAYPVGGYDAYNDTSIELVKKNGYSLAFNCEKGITTGFKNNEFVINRFNVNDNCSVEGLMKLIWSAR
jgi:peptidoglycan/xylan/chitin deacetylase (PgdA/CDA1 family)